MKAPMSDNMVLYRRKVYPIFLALSWIFGLIAGSLAFLTADLSPFSLMRSLPLSAVSIVSLLFVSLFPFLLSAAAVFFTIPWLLYGVCFFKAFSFVYVSAGFWFINGTGGWLLRLLVMFGSSLSAPFLYFFWRHSFQRTAGCKIVGAVIALIGSILAYGFDFCFISPFLVSMIVYS